MKTILTISLGLFLSLLSHAQDACWISYPGDYGIWWGNKLQSRRLQAGAHLAPFWPQYEPYSRVLFHREVSFREPEELEIRADGSLTVGYRTHDGRTYERAAIDGRLTLPQETAAIELRVANSARPPAVWVKGAHLVSDGDWKATWLSCWDTSEDVPCDVHSRYTSPEAVPGLTALKSQLRKPVWCKAYKGNHLIADFGEELYGSLLIDDFTGSGRMKIIYAESEAEMYAEELANTGDGALDGWEMVTFENGVTTCGRFPRGLRYVHLIPVEGDVAVRSLTLAYQTKGLPVRGSFKCSDEELNRIWEVSVHTLELTCREVFIEGIKRDHWVWSGDAVQSFLMNDYVFGDYEGCRDTLWALRGKDPVTCHLNRIMDYTFYWFDAVEKYRLYSGDRHFAEQAYPRMKSLLAFAIGRLDPEGRPVDRPGDWMFIDWAPKPIPNYGGVTSFEQMLFVRALEATAGVADAVGKADEAARYRARAKKLKDELVPRYWSDEPGGLLHMIYNNGKTDPMITRYPNMFGLFYGYFDEAQKASVVKNVILNDDVLKIQTPYMRFYELEALCALGRQETVTKEIKSYWGDMLRLGATSFWELYNPNDTGDAHYAMYDRRFGKSLCHAWGAAPVYLLGKYYLGVTPTSPGFATYEVKPNLGGLDWIEGDVPTPWGRIHVRADKNGHTVREIRDR